MTIQNAVWGVWATSRPHPGFMVMKNPTRGSKETVDPSVNVNCLRRSRIALSTQYTYTL